MNETTELGLQGFWDFPTILSLLPRISAIPAVQGYDS